MFLEDIKVQQPTLGEAFSHQFSVMAHLYRAAGDSRCSIVLSEEGASISQQNTWLYTLTEMWLNSNKGPSSLIYLLPRISLLNLV